MIMISCMIMTEVAAHELPSHELPSLNTLNEPRMASPDEDTFALLQILQQTTQDAKMVEERQHELLAQHQRSAEQFSAQVAAALIGRF